MFFFKGEVEAKQAPGARTFVTNLKEVDWNPISVSPCPMLATCKNENLHHFFLFNKQCLLSIGEPEALQIGLSRTRS